tara:strand:- start:208 stop:411 length:204 start_codon:yes stop_codon:yes gene_type:complete
MISKHGLGQRPAAMQGQNYGVLDRLRVSQQLLEQREQKLRSSVNPTNLLSDDGDHGKGLLKRKPKIP